MTENFIPKFYPKTLSDNSFDWILSSIGIIYNYSHFDTYDWKTNSIQSPIEWQNKIYANFDFDTYIPFHKKNMYLQKKNKEQQKSKEQKKKWLFFCFFKKLFFYFIERKYVKISKLDINKFKQACLNNYKNVNIKFYYEFIKFIITYREDGLLCEKQEYSEIIFRVWKEFDVENFITELYNIDITEFYEEIIRIEKYYIEYLI